MVSKTISLKECQALHGIISYSVADRYCNVDGIQTLIREDPNSLQYHTGGSLRGISLYLTNIALFGLAILFVYLYSVFKP